MANEYVTAEELKLTLSITGSELDDDIDLARAAASRAVDNHCGRRFWADANANQVRYYTPALPRLVEIDDLIQLTSVQIANRNGVFDTTWTENTDFVLSPLNGPLDGEPWTLLEVPYGRSNSLPTAYPRGLKVTGKFGWAEVPAAVKEATGILATKLMKRAREAPFGIVTVGGIDGVEAMRLARTDPDIGFLLSPYVRGSVVIA